MKIKILFILSILFIIFLVGCSEQEAQRFKEQYGEEIKKEIREAVTGTNKSIILTKDDFTFVGEGWLNDHLHLWACQNKTNISQDGYYVKYKLSNVPEKYLLYDYFVCQAYTEGELYHTFGLDNNIASHGGNDERSIKTLYVALTLSKKDKNVLFCCFVKDYTSGEGIQISNEVCLNKVVKAPCE